MISNIRSFEILCVCLLVYGLIQHITCILVCFYVVLLCFLKTDYALCLTSLLNKTPTFHNHITEFEGLYYQINEAKDLKVFEDC